MAVTPDVWTTVNDSKIPVFFVALGIYTSTVIIVATLKWYKVEICPRTTRNLDDVMMSVL